MPAKTSHALKDHLKKHAEAAHKAAEAEMQRKAEEYRVHIARLKKAETWLQLVGGPELDRAAKVLLSVGYTAVVATENKEQLQHNVSVVGTETWVQETFLSDLSLKFSTSPGGPIDNEFAIKLDKQTLVVSLESRRAGAEPERVSTPAPFEKVSRDNLETLVTAAVIAATPLT